MHTDNLCEFKIRRSPYFSDGKKGEYRFGVLMVSPRTWNTLTCKTFKWSNDQLGSVRAALILKIWKIATLFLKCLCQFPGCSLIFKHFVQKGNSQKERIGLFIRWLWCLKKKGIREKVRNQKKPHKTGTLTAKVNNIIIGKQGNKQWPKTYKSRYTYTQMYMCASAYLTTLSVCT